MIISDIIKNKKIFIFFYLTSFLFLISTNTATTAELDCIWCHEELTKAKYIHAPVNMGCKVCHTNIDRRHKNTGTFKKGLSAEEPDICFGCHDKTVFTKKSIHSVINKSGCTGCHNPHISKNNKLLVATGQDLCFKCHNKSMFTRKLVHGALGMGCNSCHNHHSTDYPKLTIDKMPDLCFGCHDDSDFKGKMVHKPVADKICMRCHDAHSSSNIALLDKEPNTLCIDCHRRVLRRPHAISVPGSTKGHPLGGADKEKPDPARPNKIFYCGSCHNPHSSDSNLLFRYPPKNNSGICTYCHIGH